MTSTQQEMDAAYAEMKAQVLQQLEELAREIREKKVTPHWGHIGTLQHISNVISEIKV